MADARAGEEYAELPPCIQPHGILLVLSEPELTIEAVSENLEDLLGIPARSVCGRPLAVLMHAHDARAFAAKLAEPQLIAVNPYDLTLVAASGATAHFECIVERRDGGGLIVELEPTQARLELPIYTNVQAPIERLQSATTIEQLLASAARDIREISGFERVVIYRLAADWESDVVAESVGADTAVRYLGQRFPANDITEQMRALALRSPVCMIPDTEYIPAVLIARATPTARKLDLSRTLLRDVSSDQLEYLRNLGVRAALTISLIVRGRIWGFVACHNSLPLQRNYAQRALCELMVHMLAWQLGTRSSVEDQRRGTRAAALQAQIAVILEAHDDPLAALMEAEPHVRELFAADGLAIRIGDASRSSGHVPPENALTAIAAALSRAGRAGDVAASGHLAGLLPDMREPIPAGALCIRLADDANDFLLVLRDEERREIVWAGRPEPSGSRSAKARSTFAPWREIERDRSRPWATDDITVAKALGATILASSERAARKRSPAPPGGYPRALDRAEQSEQLIGLQDAIAVALPSRAAVIDVVLDFARRSTRAGGSALEACGEREVIVEAANGSLAPHVGLRTRRAGTLSGLSATLHQTLLCDDSSTNLEDTDRELCERLNIGSMLVVPLTISPGNTLVLKVVSPRPWAFSRHDSQMLELAASNLLGALRAAHKFTALAAAEREQRTYARQLRALHAIASTTTSHRKDQIDAALHLGLEQLGLDWAFLGVIDYAAQEFVIESSVSSDGSVDVPNGARMPLGKTVIGRVALSKRVIVVDDVAQLSEAALYADWKSYIAVPLFIGGANYGAIGFTSRESRREPFSEANIEFLAVAGELIASAIERGLQRDQLESSQARYRALIEAIPQMMWVIDAANQFEYVNERWTQYTGLTLDQSRRTGRESVYFSDDLAAGGAGQTLPSVEFDCEVRLRRADGAYRWHLVRSVPFRGSADDAEKWLVTATDIEARKAAETLLADVHDAALAATEAKSRFLATMSHEIRTPMNGVIGMTELLLLTPLNEEQREYTEVIRDSGQSLLRVLNDILDYSKIEAGKLELETVQFDLPGQVESVVELLRPGYTIKGVGLVTQISPDVRTAVVGDPGRLRQILLNLAGNALKFTDTGGSVQIVVTTTHADGEIAPVRFTIKDTGIGIPPAVVDRLFQPFSQGDESTTRKYGGTGLGLSISAQLVALMGGEIGVVSEPGVGSEFWFAIPFLLAPNSKKIAETREERPKRSEPAPLRAERILLVEDNEINTFLALKQLQRLGFAVTAVTNGLQAVETVEREHYDLVLMDCHMPEMDGFEATRAIRKLETVDTPHLPIVAMTADARDEDHQNCLLAGMDDYISKPTNLDSLKAVLDRWLPAPERRRSSRNGTPLLSSAPTVGMSMLMELFNGDRAAVLDLLSAALTSITGDLKRIELASATRDFETVIEAAHRLKGTSGSIRSGRLVDVCSAIESEARTAPPLISPALLAEVRAAVATLGAEVAQRKNSDPAATR